MQNTTYSKWVKVVLVVSTSARGRTPSGPILLRSRLGGGGEGGSRKNIERGREKEGESRGGRRERERLENKMFPSLPFFSLSLSLLLLPPPWSMCSLFISLSFAKREAAHRDPERAKGGRNRPENKGDR